MDIINYKIFDLTHPDYNPRQITDKEFAELKKSLAKFDCVEPAVVNIHKTRKNIIIGGNQRVRVAESLGWQEFPCVEVSLIIAKEKELNVRLNKNTGGWDWDILANEFEIDDLIEWGFEEKELITKENIKKTKIYIEEIAKKVHFLISIPIDKIIEINPFIEEIKKIDQIEIETTQND